MLRRLAQQLEEQAASAGGVRQVAGGGGSTAGLTAAIQKFLRERDPFTQQQQLANLKVER